MNKISKYAKKSVSKLDLSIKERREFELQFVDHMTEIYNNHKLNGFSEDEALDYAINTFKEDTFLPNNILNKVFINKIYPFAFCAYSLLLISIYIYVSRLEVFRLRFSVYQLIPFRTISGIVSSSIANNSFDLTRLINHIILFIAFIPVGFLIPILIGKYRSFFSNLKTYLFISVLLEIIKLPFAWLASIDYLLLNLLSCLLGYAIFKLLIKNNYKKLLNN